MYFGYLLLYDLPKGVSPGRKTAIWVLKSRNNHFGLWTLVLSVAICLLCFYVALESGMFNWGQAGSGW
jgi:hypothetical protein